MLAESCVYTKGDLVINICQACHLVHKTAQEFLNEVERKVEHYIEFFMGLMAHMNDAL